MTIRLGIVGVGKIARDQHLPAIAANPHFDLVAAASRHASVDGIASFATIEDMLAGVPDLDAVSICTPPGGRSDIVRAAIAAGKHVMIEKPPGATVSEVVALERLAADAGVTLFATWHSREASGVDAARDWLADKQVTAVAISWREDIRVWHPGQDWILGPGGFGVFDPGINALSIVTKILPTELSVESGALHVPDGRESPIAATVQMRCGNGAPGRVDLDFLQTGPQSWDIVVETTAGTLTLRDGGKTLSIDGEGATEGGGIDEGEYPRLYARFAELVPIAGRDVDLRPLQLVADAYLVAHRIVADPFEF